MIAIPKFQNRFKNIPKNLIVFEKNNYIFSNYLKFFIFILIDSDSESSVLDAPESKYVLVKWLSSEILEFTVLLASNVITTCKYPVAGITYKVKYGKDVFDAVVLKLGKVKLYFKF